METAAAGPSDEDRNRNASRPRAFGVEDVPLLTRAEMRAWDRHSIHGFGVSEGVLIEAAGRAAARLIQRLYPHGRVVGAFGRGHNGADTLVALRTLRAWGRDTLAVPVEVADSDPALLHGWEVPLLPGEPAAAFASAGVLIDGILGTGASGAPREPQAAVIEAMNGSGRPIVALDGPSGVELSTGQTEGAAIRAELTVTFGAPKRGLLLYPGRLCAGRIVAVEVGLSPLQSQGASAAVITPRWARARTPGVAPNAHKGTLGTVAVIAGATGMAGAAVLVGTGAARAGAGKVLLVSAAENRIILQIALPEALFYDRDSEELSGLLETADAVVTGPGMGTDEVAQRVLRAVLRHGDAPLVLDADALTLISRDPDLLEGVDRPRLLTPHPSELARLLDEETKEVVADPFAAAERAVQRFGCSVLLKGAPSLVAAPGERMLANVTGHSGIATGGMGDTLAGIAVAFLAIGCTPRDAGALALYYSGRAAEIAGRGRSLLPRDVADALPAAFLEPDAVSSLDIPGITLDLPVPR
ncbi:NAD(P)H-hydrate dehydratase [soil metagenome]